MVAAGLLAVAPLVTSPAAQGIGTLALPSQPAATVSVPTVSVPTVTVPTVPIAPPAPVSQPAPSAPAPSPTPVHVPVPPLPHVSVTAPTLPLPHVSVTTPTPPPVSVKPPPPPPVRLAAPVPASGTTKAVTSTPAVSSPVRQIAPATAPVRGLRSVTTGAGAASSPAHLTSQQTSLHGYAGPIGSVPARALSGYGAPGEPNPATRSRSSRGSGLPGSLSDASVAAFVRSLQGCLGAMPRRLRTVLVLLGGVGLPRPLSSRQAAAHLHISLGRLRALERKALLGLRSRAHTNRCAGAAGLSGAEFLFAGGIATGASFGAPGPRRGEGGVASYRAAAAGGGSTNASPSKLTPLTAGPGGALSRPAGDNLVVVLSAAGACLLLLLVVCAQVSGLIGGSRERRSGRGGKRRR